MVYANHVCPRCGSQGITTDSYKRKQCLLCGYADRSLIDEPYDVSPEIWACMYVEAHFYLRDKNFGGLKMVSVQ